tara:strand:- start:5773 stop:9078 length:3306 start_codon:yes stop_codon:yes gene_type:complete
MAKYPKLYGNTYSAYDIHKSTAPHGPIKQQDNEFDVYVYSNAGLVDNTQRASAVFVIKNEQVEGTTTALNVDSISLRDPNNTANLYSGNNITLDPQISAGNAPFIGSQENFEGNTGNLVAEKDTGNKPGVTAGGGADTAAGLEIGMIKVPNTADVVIDSDDLDPSLSSGFQAILVHDPNTISANTGQDNPIPSNSYAAFVVAFHPTQDIANNTIECVLRVSTVAGLVDFNLTVNSFNEIIMVAHKGTATNVTNDLTIDTGTITHDNGDVNLGLHPRTRTLSNFGANLVYQGVEITDVSPNSQDASYKWTNTNNATVAFVAPVSGDDANLDKPSDYSWGSLADWMDVDLYYEDADDWGGTIAYSGDTGSLDEVAGNYNLYYFFDPEEAMKEGTRTNTNYGKNYVKSSFARCIVKRLRYLSTQYNNTNIYNANFPDDGTGTRNQYFKYRVLYGVYEKVTVPSNQVNAIPKNRASGSSSTSGSYPIYYVDNHTSVNGRVPETGTTYHYQNAVRWNNFRRIDDTTKYTLASFSIASNTSNFKFIGTNCEDSLPTSISVTGPSGTYLTTGTFSHFKFDNVDNKDCHIKSPFTFTLPMKTLYGDNQIIEEDGDGTTLQLTPTEQKYGVIDAFLTPDYNDNVWNFNDGTDANEPDYPGLHENHDINYKAKFFPRDSYFTFGHVTSYQMSHSAAEVGYPSGTGLSEQIQATVSLDLVSSWYNSASQVLPNTVSGFTTNNSNNLYSGHGGKTFSNSSWNTTIGCADANATVNGNKREIRDHSGNSIPEFYPDSYVYKFPNPKKHPSTDVYTTFVKFHLINEGDYNIYLHSIKPFSPTYSTRANQMLDFDVSAAGNNIFGTSVFGYKPSHNGTDTNDNNANSSSDPVLSFLVKDIDTTFQNTEKIYGPNSYTPTNGQAIDYYRSHGADAVFFPPKPLLAFHAGTDANFVAEAANNHDPAAGLINSNSTVFNSLESAGSSEGQTVGLENNGTDPNGNGGYSNNSPQSCKPIFLRVEIPSKGSSVDFGDYYVTLKVRYYKDNYQNRRKISTSDVEDTEINPLTSTPIADIKIHEKVMIFKVPLIPEPILAISDNEGEEFTDTETIHMGNINIG